MKNFIISHLFSHRLFVLLCRNAPSQKASREYATRSCGVRVTGTYRFVVAVFDSSGLTDVSTYLNTECPQDRGSHRGGSVTPVSPLHRHPRCHFAHCSVLLPNIRIP